MNPFVNTRISIASEYSDELFTAFQRLIPQLTRNNPPPTRAEIERLLRSPGTIVFIARHPDFGDEIIGAAALILYRVPTGLRAYIEDVIVDERARGRGIGEALTQAAVDRAAAEGAPSVGLTSNPERLAANRLYQRMGFELRQTNVYRKKTDPL